MEDMGWQPPEVSEGPNFWAEVAQENSDRVAELAVAALRDVYGVQHPVFLAPTSWPRCSTRRHRSRDPDAAWSEPRSPHRWSSAASCPVTAST